MTTLSFKEQYQHPSWQKRRLDILNLAGWACSACGSGDRTLHVHHKHYVKGRMVWEYSDDELEALCDECHRKKHDRKDFLRDLMLAADGPGIPADMLAIGLIAGYRYSMGELSEELAAQAYSIAGPFFEDGMVGCSATTVRGPDLAPLIREAAARWGTPIPPLLDEVLQRLQNAQPMDF